jgi:hypothetical protein
MVQALHVHLADADLPTSWLAEQLDNVTFASAGLERCRTPVPPG